MKKSLLKFLSFAISASMAASLVTAPVYARTALETARGDADLRFAVIGDAHITAFEDQSGYTALPALQNGLDKLNDYEVDLLAMNGDMVLLNSASGVSEVPYNTLYTELNAYFPDTPYFYAVGNHEFILGSTDEEECAQTLSLFETETKQTAKYHYTTESGHHFITAAGYNYNSYMNEDTLAWLETELTAALQADETKPVFLMLHHPMHETYISSDSVAETRYSAEFKEFLNKNPRIINLSGHVHASLQNPRTIWQDGFTVIQTGMMGGGNMHGDGFDVASKKEASQGMIIEVDDSVVSAYKIDLISGDFIGEPWVIDTSDSSTFKYTSSRTSNAPVFDGELTVDEVADTRAIVTFPKAVVSEDGNTETDFAAGYIVTATDANGEVVSSVSYQSDYYAQSTADSFTKEITGLSRNADYTLKVVAANPFGVESEPITAKITTLANKTYKVTNPTPGASLSYNATSSKEVKVTVEDAGIYSFSASLNSSTGAGRIKASVDGQNGAVIASFTGAESMAAITVSDAGYLYLTEGDNTILLKNDGKGVNNEYCNYVQWDWINLSYCPDKTITDVSINLEAEDYIGGAPDASATQGNEKTALLYNNKTAVYNVDIPADGQYDVIVNARNPWLDETTVVEGTITCGGKETPFSYDFAGLTTAYFRDFKLATLNLAKGENSFTVKVTTDALYMDYFLLKKSGEYILETHYELEVPKVDGSYYLVNTHAPKTVEANVSQAGVYAVSLNLGETATGKVRVIANDQIVDYEYTNGTTDYAMHDNIGYLYLEKGANTIYIANDRRNDGTYDDYILCDLIEIDFCEGKTKNDVVWYKEAEAATDGTYIASGDGVLENDNSKSILMYSSKYATYTVNVPTDGQYKLSINGSNPWVASDASATGTVTYGGKNIAFSQDFTGYTGAQYHNVELCTLNMTEGENVLTITVSGAALYIDRITLERVGEYILQTHYELEVPKASGSYNLEHSKQPKTVEANVSQAGVYAVSMSINREAGKNGKIKVTSNETGFSYEFSTGDNNAYYMHENVGYIYLNKGANTISVSNDGRGENASFDNYVLCNGIELDFCDDKVKSDAVLFVEAETYVGGNPYASATIGNETTALLYSGATAEYSIIAPADGKYDIYVSARNPWNDSTTVVNGSVTASGKETAFSCDFAGLSTTQFRNVKIATLDLTEGTNSFTVKVTEDALYMDYFLIQRVGEMEYQTEYEAEITSTWLAAAESVSAPKTVTVNVQKTGIYALSANLSSADGSARLKAIADSQIILHEFEKTSDFRTFSDIGYFYLEKGENKITLHNDGKGANSLYANYFQCNKIKLTYCDDKTKDDVIWFVEAEDYTGGTPSETSEPVSGVVAVALTGGATTNHKVTAPDEGKYTVLINASNPSSPTKTVSGTVMVGDTSKQLSLDYTDTISSDYRTVSVGIFDMTAGENTIKFAVTTSQLNIDYIMFKKYVTSSEDPIVSAINSAKTPADIKEVMEDNKDIFSDYDTIIASMFYPDALYEKFIGRNFASLDALTAEWSDISVTEAYFAPSVNLTIDGNNATALASGAAKVIVTPYKVDSGVTVIAAVYENDMLKAIDSGVTVADSSVILDLGTLSIDESKTYTFKLLYWNSFETMIPYEKEYNENF